MKIEFRNNSIEIEGYVNTVARDSRVIQVKGKKIVEQILPGVWSKALLKGNDIKLLFNHDKGKVLGSIGKGNIHLKEDNIGLKIVCTIYDSEVIKKAKDKKLKGWSFGFVTIDESFEKFRDIERRYIKDLDLLEISILDVTPAYVGTSIEQRAEKNTREVEIRGMKNLDNQINHTEEIRMLEAEKGSIIFGAKQENRDLNLVENTRLEAIKYQIKGLEKEMSESQEKNSERMLGVSISKESKEAKKELRMLKDVILPKEKFKTEKRSSGKKLNFGKLVKGMSGKGWHNAIEEREYYSTMESNNSVVVPTEITDNIIDLARANSAIVGEIPVIPMTSNNLTVLTQVKDAEAHFVNEGDLIPSSEAIFEGVDLKGKTLALFVPINLQLLESANNLDTQLEMTTAKAIVTALDKAIAYGKGISTDKSRADEIKGITLYDTVNKINHNKADYDLPLLGAKAIKKANLIPTNITYNSDLACELDMLKDVNGQYIAPPRALEGYIKTESNNISENTAIAYDSNSMLLGLHQDIKIEWGTTQDQFQRLQVGLRVYLRADLAVVNPKGITVATVVQSKGK